MAPQSYDLPMSQALPIPPPEMRDLIGAPDLKSYDNPSGELVHRYLPASAYESVLDFGCGCGRAARQLIQQRPRPTRYLGVDLHRGMIAWCERELAPHAEEFRFVHQDVYNPGLNPSGAHRVLPLPAGAGEFSLVNAESVFTHTLQDQAEFYLREAARVLRPDGFVVTTWFLFDKRQFPMMQSFQNALYINEVDPSNAVIFDRLWLQETVRDAGLVITWAQPPEIRGFHWRVVMRAAGTTGARELELPDDEAPFGSIPAPLMPADADHIGLRR